MAVSVELDLVERQGDRVVVSLWLAPDGEEVTSLDGASVRLVDAAGEELCPRTQLPIAGGLHSTMALSVELRGSKPLPEGARVIALAWSQSETWEASCPADPYVRLADHMKGSCIGLPDAADVLLEPLSGSLRQRLESRWPWVAQSTRPAEVAGVIEAEAEPVTPDDIVDDLGLGEEDAAWLKDLLDEEV